MKVRQSGVLMHISSLPGAYGIGSMGKSAYEFVDFLVRTKQRYWQILPLGTTSYGDSPYQSFSAFAGNTHFIDLDLLIEEGWLTEKDVQGIDFGQSAKEVDYAKVFTARRPILEQVVASMKEAGLPQDYWNFLGENDFWIHTFAEYMAIKEHFDNKSWIDWEDQGARLRYHDTLEYYRHLLVERIDYHRITQYLFFKQWQALKAYANAKGIEFVGDMPIYIAADSADMWANPHFFKTDEEGKPSVVAGCPPDAFSEIGQLWGNPIYDWEAMKADGFTWWVARLRESFKIYDMVRIDHFIGFASFWEIPAGEETAVNGYRVEAPGFELFDTIKRELGDLNIIAEDLGSVTDKVIQLRDWTGFPGMKVLQFAFDPEGDSIEMPHNHRNNVVAYTGTHDNDTISGWYERETTPESRAFLDKYSNRSVGESIHHALFRLLFGSPAFMTIVTMQDLLELDGTARMNLPNTLGGNWTWRMTADQLTPAVEANLLDLTVTYRRENVLVTASE
ncbi:TPA: 4-alpha-glucanotransferase [Streptococcus suis]|uniref:4-alpha-glucanotransferase n=1 Tax=Streptococcus TaxID=1301 RepID=UPI000CF5AB74|nr:4-alpha-glucanotransferase [Streptococcus suis]UUM57167.1 4-alpha-glucanotransferase [Streptococcus suis]UUM60980.1 4-alpha-glucanotransferase [Streptococcus suis]